MEPNVIRKPEDYHGPEPTLAQVEARAEASAQTASYWKEPHSFLTPAYTTAYDTWTHDQRVWARGVIDGVVVALTAKDTKDTEKQASAVQSAIVWLLSAEGQKVLHSL